MPGCVQKTVWKSACASTLFVNTIRKFPAILCAGQLSFPPHCALISLVSRHNLRWRAQFPATPCPGWLSFPPHCALISLVSRHNLRWRVHFSATLCVGLFSYVSKSERFQLFTLRRYVIKENVDLFRRVYTASVVSFKVISKTFNLPCYQS